MTQIPYAIVESGDHTLTLHPKRPVGGPGVQPVIISATLEEGKSYRIAVQEGNVVVVEDSD